ncbi:hypothetical protein JX266_011929 [Neoarthrinium moseri]|uniref:uncharacterized protein n=1 Tax=Neoarthrinium moseri TaxID=1658444 RepID=UPI001FDE8328|nr:uncharacterized protein JN550_010595 [Neoarthrinium moseri]KAI1841851.1 hypothetical protein JX266_011929 [Neoarthrinium moseri]KAI1861964.1 hypothetical protein JN550_010595 [Neoarthrinium moseri]
MHVGIPIAAGAVAIYLAARLIYLAFLHPLAKYPGPFLSKFTFARASYYAWKGDIHIDIWRCHEKYGDYVRYGPNQLLVNTAEGLQDIYGRRTSTKFLKSKHYEVMMHQAANTFTHRGGKDHLVRRRILAQGVSAQAQREYETRIATHIEKFCGAVFDGTATNGSGAWSEPRNMAKWCNYLSFDMMADIVFGAQYNLLGDDRFRYVTEMMEKSNVRISALVQFPSLSWLRLDKHLFQEAIFARNRFLKFVFRLLRDRMELSNGNVCGIFEKSHATSQLSYSTKSRDIYSRLQEARDPQTGAGLRKEEMASESTTLIVAGSDTTSCCISSVLFYLSDNPQAYQKAAQEVRSCVSSQDDITGSNLASCTYLRACIDEALRMSPPVGTALVREVMTEGTLVSGQPVPVGCEVGVGTYAIHHSSQTYPEPFVYKPERWLEGNAAARASFIPFSAGIRSCLGKGLAYTEITLVIANLLFRGDFKFADGELGNVGRGGNKSAVYGRHRENEYQLYDHIAGQKKGPWLQFSRRVLS